jgi:acyl-CoA thioester hydrolase
MTVDTITFDLEIYPYHIDFTGYVSAATYVQWLEMGRLKLLYAVALPLEQLMTQDIFPLLTQTQLQHVRQLRFGDRVTAELWLLSLSPSRITIQQQFYTMQRELIAIGTQQFQFTRRSTEAPCAISAEWVRLFEPYLRPA